MLVEHDRMLEPDLALMDGAAAESDVESIDPEPIEGADIPHFVQDEELVEDTPLDKDDLDEFHARSMLPLYSAGDMDDIGDNPDVDIADGDGSGDDDVDVDDVDMFDVHALFADETPPDIATLRKEIFDQVCIDHDRFTDSVKVISRRRDSASRKPSLHATPPWVKRLIPPGGHLRSHVYVYMYTPTHVCTCTN